MATADTKFEIEVTLRLQYDCTDWDSAYTVEEHAEAMRTQAEKWTKDAIKEADDYSAEAVVVEVI